jgi:hypothetical protein
MGHGSWDAGAWSSYSTNKGYDKATHAKEIFKETKVNQMLDPKGVKIRESRDSVDNPNSTPIIVALDVTGSMGMVLKSMATTGLNTMVTSIHSKKPVSDPHVMCMGVGDVETDAGPLQVTQFEADLRIAEQLEKIWLEQGGGGNSYESYILPWYFAAFHTETDAFDKRGKKGYIFTVGDENPTPLLRADDLERVLGYKPQKDYHPKELLKLVSKKYEVFHIIVAEGSHYRSDGKTVMANWKGMLGQRALLLEDHTKMGELIISTMQVHEGSDPDDVAKAWGDKELSKVIHSAIGKYNRNVELDF